MTTDLDLARARMTEIIQWWPILDDVADSLLGITGHGVTLDGVRSDNADSATELAVIQLDQIDQISVDLAALAKKMGWRSGLDGPARHYVHAHLPWARANLSPHEVEPVITDIHKRIARLTGYAPRSTGRTCPGCGEDQLHIVEEGLYCAACDLTRHPDEVQALTLWRLQNANTHVTRKEAALILGEPENTIKQRIRRRQPTFEVIDKTRHYHLGDLK